MTRTPMPGLAVRARHASITTAPAKCYCCADLTEAAVDLIVTVGFMRYDVHRAHLEDADVVRLLGKIAA
jgi:hypothetical protein